MNKIKKSKKKQIKKQNKKINFKTVKIVKITNANKTITDENRLDPYIEYLNNIEAI